VAEAYQSCPQLLMYGVYPSYNDVNRWAYTVYDSEQHRHRRFVTDSLSNVIAKLCLSTPDDDTDE
jgi:hypothetical protein